MKIKVVATAPNSLNITHPADGPLREGGSMWELDGFTCRMLADGAIKDASTDLEKPVADKLKPLPKSDA